MNHSKQSTQNKSSTLFQGEAWKNALIKLLPQHAIKNPVMAIVWLGTIITLVSTLTGQADTVFGLAVTLILFITVLFANYAEA
ncbi:potassium-transporting ATPase subunit B, partial [Acinetobacter geminorum]